MPASVPRVQVESAPPARGRARRRDTLTSLLLALLGIALLAYPLLATYAKNLHQLDVTRAYDASVAGWDSHTQHYWLDRAHDYNARSAGMPILDPWLARISDDNELYRAYLEELNPSDKDDAPIGVLTIPSIRSSLPIYHGTDLKTLDRGVGHLFGSALPVGGTNTHSVLTAHSGLIEATLFDRLPDVGIGDAVYIETMGTTLKYQVHSTEIVLPEQTSSLEPVVGEDLLTMITCTPYGVNTHRLLVHAHRVPMEAFDQALVDGTRPAIWQWWMTIVVGIVALAALGHLWLGYRRRRHDGDDDPHRESPPDDEQGREREGKGKEDEDVMSHA